MTPTARPACITCGGPRTMPKGKARYTDRTTYETDPFCSRPCAEAWYAEHRGERPPLARVTCQP